MAIIKLEEGRYALRWRDARGKRHYETLDPMPYKRVVQEHAKRLANRDAETTSTATVAQLAKDYLEVHGPGLTPAGLERAESIIRLHITPDPIGKVIAANLKTRDLLAWRQRRKTAGASDGTLDREHNVVRAIIGFAVKTDTLAVSPLKRGAVKRLVPSTEGRTIYFEPEEWRAFIDSIENDAAWTRFIAEKRRFGPVKIGAAINTPRRNGAGACPGCDHHEELGHTRAEDYRERLRTYRALFVGLLWTASRLSEIRKLMWQDVDLRNGYVCIQQGKTGKRKTVPMSQELRASLEALPRGVGRAPVYAAGGGVPFSKRAVQRAFAVYCKVAGLRDELTPHAIRHTAATWMVISGRPILEVSRFLGHASLAMTLRYAHLAPVHLTAALAGMETMRNSMSTTITETPEGGRKNEK